jgi:hypothetical protein
MMQRTELTIPLNSGRSRTAVVALMKRHGAVGIKSDKNRVRGRVDPHRTRQIVAELHRGL